MKKRDMVTAAAGLVLSFCMVLAGCSGNGVGGSNGGSGTTIVSGKVTLSSSLLGKPGQMNLQLQKQLPIDLLGGKASGNTISNTVLTSANDKLNAALSTPSFSGATVDMYDSDHPEWLYPVATGTTASDGSYTLSSMTNAAKNEGATYKDGDPIPAGSYTLVAYSGFGIGQKPTVAVQSIVKNFEGTIANVDFEILPSDVAPAVIYMFGASKVTDDQGNETWGTTTTPYPANAAIQLTFSMPLWRDSLAAGIEISPLVAGHWSLSADWLSATYYFDPGVQMTPGQIYTVTVYGDDQYSHDKVLNVYGNSLQKTAFGTFKASAADTISPTVQWNNPTVMDMGKLVDVTQPFRIESNKLLDVNGITLHGIGSTNGPDGNPVTIGVKPGVLYLGKNAAGLYVYEFMLGEPLALNTSYNLTVFNGKDLSGHVMNTLTGSITTNNAEDTPGIDPLAQPDIQNMQAQVKSVFGRWVRAMNDRNLGQWQNVLSGEFYLEYDSSRGIDTTSDINRDGRFSFGEFSNMLYSKGFPQWDYCGTTLTGVLSSTTGTSDFINVVPLTMTADFEFKLTATNVINSQQCTDSAPKDTFYATVKYMNGGWRIVRASEGIDNRNKELNKLQLITTRLYEQTPFFGYWTNNKEIFDGMPFSKIPDADNLRGKFTWDSVSGVNTYVLVIADERKPKNGMAIALSNNVTSYITGTANDPFTDISNTNALDLSAKFGFNTDHTGFKFEDGGRYYWEVIGFGSATSKADPTNPNDPNFIGNKAVGDLLKDISSTSTVKRFVMPLLYYDILVQVRPGTSTLAVPIKYDAGLGGYDLGNAYQATLTIQTRPTATWGLFAIWGSQLKSEQFLFVNGTYTKTVTLYNGMNDIYIYDSMEALMAENNNPIPRFRILTAQGMPPVINIWEVKDDSGTTLDGDKWHYYRAPGAKKVSITGAVSDMTVNNLNVTVRNEFGPQYSVSSLPTDSSSGDNIFTTADLTTSPTPPDLDIYQGTNYIDLNYRSGSTQYFASLIVYTDTGSVWVPPITITSITAANSGITKLTDYSTSADWDASLGSGSNYTATITGTFKTPGVGNYNTWSKDGGGSSWSSLVSDSSGNFSFTVLLYAGWNDVSLWDPSGNNGYWLHINTNATGKPIIKPTIMTINGASYNGSGTFATTQCSATIAATAEPGKMSVNWQGNDGLYSYYEYQNFQNLDAPPARFSFVVSLVSTTAGASGNSSNVVSIQDGNWRSAGVTITTTGNCPYVQPTTTWTELRDSNNTLITLISDTNSSYNAGSNSTVNIKGTTSRPGATITASYYACSENENYTIPADGSGNWTISGINLYNGGGWISVSGPGSWIQKYIQTSTNITPTTRLQIPSNGVVGATQDSNSCGQSSWTAGGNTAITINGTSTYLNGTGEYTDALNSTHQFTISNGQFTLANVPVYQGANNNIRINIYNDPLGSSSHYMSVTTSNNVPKPQYVTITSLTSGGSYTGSLAISGSVTDANASGFNAANATLTAYVSGGPTYGTYSNDTYYQQQYGYAPIAYNNGNFSFDYDFGLLGSCTYVTVYAYDRNTGEQHYEDMVVNCLGPHTYAKPGAPAPPPDMNQQWVEMQQAEATRRFLLDMNR